MNVIRSKVTGYCHGVNKTIRNAYRVLKEAEKAGLPAYSIGNLIHNEDAVHIFERAGMKVIKKPDVEPGIALIRAHGIADSDKRAFEEKNFTLIDSTCENIIKTKNGIKQAFEDNRTIVVIGVKNHAETNTLLGTTNAEKYLVSNMSELDGLLDSLDRHARIAVAVQTTFSEAVFLKMTDRLENTFDDIVFLNKLCAACLARKSNAMKLAKQCDAIFVVGGKKSSNTNELAFFIKKSKKPVYLVENVKDFDSSLDREISKYKTVGVCSGTSTPQFVINAVCKHLEVL